jgi:3-deoxy-manno-octulosonate cytidylyltransferase (CMP-KDO synthetase)
MNMSHSPFKVLILIPARYHSTRFPGKPLATIKGKTLIQRVYEQCQKIQNTTIQFDSYVVTDSTEISNHLDEIKAKYVRIDDVVETGSERIFLAYTRFFQDKKYDLVINVQGDEPLICPDDIIRLATTHTQSTFGVMTMVRAIEGLEHDFFDTNRVKAIYVPQTNACLYFSRAPIPHPRGIEPNAIELKTLTWYLHIGVYSFRPEALISFSKSSIGYYENIEKLEQLRMMENGIQIGAIETQKQLIGVDTPEDIQKILAHL